MFCALHDQLASLDRHAQLTRYFSEVAELLVFFCTHLIRLRAVFQPVISMPRIISLINDIAAWYYVSFNLVGSLDIYCLCYRCERNQRCRGWEDENAHVRTDVYKPFIQRLCSNLSQRFDTMRFYTERLEILHNRNCCEKKLTRSVGVAKEADHTT